MRWHEVASGFQVPVSSEEQDIINRIGNGKLPDTELDERDAEVARKMASRGLLKTKVIDDVPVYTVDSSSSIWR